MSNIKVGFAGVDNKGLPKWKIFRGETPVKASELTKEEIKEVGIQARQLRAEFNV